MRTKALDEAVVLGPMPTSSRGSDVKGGSSFAFLQVRLRDRFRMMHRSRLVHRFGSEGKRQFEARVVNVLAALRQARKVQPSSLATSSVELAP